MTLLGVMIVACAIAADLDIASIAYCHDYDLISDNVAVPRASLHFIQQRLSLERWMGRASAGTHPGGGHRAAQRRCRHHSTSGPGSSS